jgi:hydrogenase expression/formation protein HypC
MCLGVPGRVIEIYETEGLKMGKIDFGGVVREACLAYVPEIEVGEYTIIHVGFAISQLSEEEAQATLEILNELSDIQDEIGPDPGSAPGPQTTAQPAGTSETRPPS